MIGIFLNVALCEKSAFISYTERCGGLHSTAQNSLPPPVYWKPFYGDQKGHNLPQQFFGTGFELPDQRNWNMPRYWVTL